MKREFFLILISVCIFIAINTIFYFTIYNQQLDFQTGLLARQARVCGNTIEREGQQFENELNSIPYQDDFSKLFSDEEIKQRGSINLQKLYTGFSQLINKITVYDDHNNVYSLILDAKNNFVSDYYESQRQTPLIDRDQLIDNQDKYMLSIPGFNKTGHVQSNILVDINFTRFVDAIFERYTLEQILWHCLISDEGELISTASSDITIPEGDLKRIGSYIREESEGFFIHTILVDSIPTKVVSAYYPVHLVKRNLGIIFSIKSDLFLQSIIIKFIIITVCSLILLALFLYIHFRVISVRFGKIQTRDFSENSLFKTLNVLPVGFLLFNPDGSLQMMNQSARKILFLAKENINPSYSDLGLDDTRILLEDSIYHRSFGPGVVLLIRNESIRRQVYKMEWGPEASDTGARIVMLIDVSDYEISMNMEKISQLARSELLEGMAREISVPLQQLQNAISELSNNKSKGSSAVESLNKSLSLLTNLINATLDFAGKKAGDVVVEEIPFYLSSEIDLAIDPFRSKSPNISIITKIRNDVPEKLVGDPFRLRQALSNLVENAMELTEEGRILISTEVLEHHSGLYKLQFQVEDTGSGLPPEKMKEIINELDRDRMQLAEKSDGFKLRLGMARQHIELMKGNLWLETPSSISTNPDQPGIKYTFTIDVFAGESIKENLILNEVRQLEEIECLVLSQENETETERFKPLLDLGLKIKFLVYRKENTKSLFELVSEKASSVHLLIVINSPGQDGFHLTENLIRKGLVENQVLILLSSVQKQENYSYARNLNIDYYIEEPYETYRFVEILTKHFPSLDKEQLGKVPTLEKTDPGLSILLAEDNLFNRKVIQGLFKRLGHEIDLAENGIQAVNMTGAKEYDIIFMDLLMPEMDGIQAVAEIRKQGIKAPIIALTAVEDNEARSAAMEAGFDDYLIKPASEESLRKILLQNQSKSV